MATLTWGVRISDPEYVLSEAEFISWAPNYFATYVCPADWVLEPKTRCSAHIETWRAPARNMSKMFAAVYGTEHLNERLTAVEELRALHVREPRKYTLPFIRNACGTLNHMWIQELKESTNILRMHANVERPTYDHLKAIGMTVDPNTCATVFGPPDTFAVRGPGEGVISKRKLFEK